METEEDGGIALQEFHPEPEPNQEQLILPLDRLTPASSNPSTATADSGIALLNRQPEGSKSAAR